jgi:hypothetical protein
MQGWITAQWQYCAGPRLAQARDASLEHNESCRDTEKQQAAVLWTACEWGENHYDGKCLKTIRKVKYQYRIKIFFLKFPKTTRNCSKKRADANFFSL